MKVRITSIVFLLVMVMTACKPVEKVCPPEDLVFAEDVSSLPTPTPPAEKVVEIGGKTVQFDQVIHGPLCNNKLSGNVYIACDVIIAPWKDSPNFLDGCNFEVDPGAVITVAAHNNAVYYKGCASCHVSGGGN